MTEIIENKADQLVAGVFPRMTDSVLLKTGTEFKRGDVLELDVDSKGINVADASNAKYILAEDVDATAADTEALVFTTGEFNAFACNFGALAQADVKEALHVRSIFLK